MSANQMVTQFILPLMVLPTPSFIFNWVKARLRVPGMPHLSRGEAMLSFLRQWFRMPSTCLSEGVWVIKGERRISFARLERIMACDSHFLGPEARQENKWHPICLGMCLFTCRIESCRGSITDRKWLILPETPSVLSLIPSKEAMGRSRLPVYVCSNRMIMETIDFDWLECQHALNFKSPKLLTYDSLRISPAVERAMNTADRKRWV